MQEIINRLSSAELDDKTYNATIVETLLPLIKSGLKSQIEVPRHEFIKVLAMSVKAFPQHSALNHLGKLTDADVEVDFFENICHIQVRLSGSVDSLVLFLSKLKLALVIWH
jgi:hypothetical protein